MPGGNNVNKPRSMRRPHQKPKSVGGGSGVKKVTSNSLPRAAKRPGKHTLPKVGGVLHGGVGHSLAKAEKKKKRNAKYALQRAVEAQEKAEGDVGMNDADDLSALSNRQRKKLAMAEKAALLNKKPEEKEEEKKEGAAATEETMDVDMDGVA